VVFTKTAHVTLSNGLPDVEGSRPSASSGVVSNRREGYNSSKMPQGIRAFPSSDFRPMHRGDLHQVLEIERKSFREPWDRDHFLLLLERRDALLVVAERHSRAAGYFAVEFQGPHTHIINLAVHPEHRRRGLGSRALELVETLARQSVEKRLRFQRGTAVPPAVSRHRSPSTASLVKEEREAEARRSAPAPEIFLEVHETNLPAQLLYRKMGYRATKVLRNHYPALREDAYKMVKVIGTEPQAARDA
jgi:ribosomal-protein-alanine N-acetyltransferase